MTIDTSQNVGIGITPSAWGTNYSQKALQIGPVGSLSSLNAGTGNQQTNIVNNAYFDGASWRYITSDGAMLYSQTSTTVGHTWQTAASGTAGNTLTFTERMRIDPSGNVCIGGTAFGPGSNSLNLWTIPGNNNAFNVKPTTNSNYTVAQFFNNGGTQVGSITCTTSATAYNSGSSDYRLKENITSFSKGLNNVLAMNPVSFNWKDTGELDIGFIAHEIQSIIPSTVTGEKDGVDKEGNPVYQTIYAAPPQMIASIVAAIKEQQTIINDLKARIETLEGAK